MTVHLLEARDVHGPGLAYDSPPRQWIMNGMASRLSAIDDIPDHFVKWLCRNVCEDRTEETYIEAASLYAQRREYGRYIKDLLRKRNLRNRYGTTVTLVKASAIKMKSEGHEFLIQTNGEGVYKADAVILAVGNQPPRRIFHQQGAPFIENPWTFSDWRLVPKRASLLLVGTGQTMMDIVSLLAQRGHRGSIWAISRHGLLPQSQAIRDGFYQFDLDPLPRELTALFRYVRDSAEAAPQHGANWRDVLIALRPLIQRHWMQLSLDEQTRFFRHLLPYWRVHRTRVSPDTWNTVHQRIASGQLRVLAARLKSVVERDTRVDATLVPRGDDRDMHLSVDMAINCTGPNNDYSNVEEPLLRQLLMDGAIVPHPNGIGLHVKPNGAIIDSRGKTYNRVYAIGPPCEGTLLESTVIREIRSHAIQLAKCVIQELRPN
jgi:uncharacterized NAD(P)/FAD-binding protein YdhS